ncbi:MAG: histidine triad nucleotide-binding protein [Patescibacteria group bacterium]
MECIFCRIVNKEVPTEVVYEDEDILVFPDIRPKASIHLLLVPKKHISTLQEVEESDTELMGRLLLTAQKVAREKQLKGYKLAMNVGKDGEQEINHLHLHFLAS